MLAALVGGLLIATAAADSQARIVRLSDVQGDVQIDRNSGRGFEKALLNMPITEGCKIWTKDDGRAEIEFEDGSVLRVVPDTKVDFSQLSLRDSGSRVSTIDVQQGTAYINFLGKKDDEFTVNFAHESARLMHAAHLRADVDDLSASLAVFKGDVAVQGPSGSVEVEKDHSASFDLMNNDRYTMARSYEEDPYDEWDKQAQQYHQRYSTNSYDASIPYDYGVSDLSYYGSFINCPGYGYLWQPYFAGMGWSPFMDGAWMWYPGFGYTWVSAYPWGWLPYRYGTWMFVPGFGWGWQPGGWTTWYPVTPVRNPPPRYTPPQPPATTGGGRTVVVGTGPSAGGALPPRRLTINQGTAGLGIPRGGISNLPKVSQRVIQQGSATVRTSPSAGMIMGGPGTGWGNSGWHSGGGMSRSTGSSHASTSHTSSSGHSSSGSKH
jgi:hypothetical protein